MATNDSLGQKPAALITGLVQPKLLIVDDNPINIQMLYQAFSADHRVYMATSGRQALEVCFKQKPDLILLDIEMPDISGYEVCTQLKAHSETKDIPIIFVTAHIDEETETRCFNEGGVDFISKPVNRNTVRARVRTHLLLKAQSDLLRQLVYLDGLTEVHNRRYFDIRLNQEWELASRHKTPLSLIIIDVDFFKKYNDLYGHLAGDDCLRIVAKAIGHTLKRPTDLVARYGGEEFACLLPNTELMGAVEVAEAIRLQVIKQAIPHADSSVLPFVSISLGVCCRRADGTGTLADFLLQADTQLYKSKANGKNQTCGTFLENIGLTPK
ncbi:diguanylate cyclase [Serratia aquatilis]|uniref:diguanylate cyclase n=1 Tax=Serratia aquatilis TaxID=1737515 RepID=A0ABV6EK38_9GAMM